MKIPPTLLSRLAVLLKCRKQKLSIIGLMILATLISALPAISRPTLQEELLMEDLVSLPEYQPPVDPMPPSSEPTPAPTPPSTPVPAPHPTPPAPTPLSVNGCTIVLDKVPGVFDFTQPCNKHDLCYGAQLGKTQCDVAFFKDMEKYCTGTYASSYTQRSACLEASKTYYMGVVALGGPFYQPSPNTMLVEMLDSNGARHGFFEVRPDGTQIMYTAAGTIFELPSPSQSGSTAWILNNEGQRVGQLNNYTLRQDGENIIGIEGTSPNGDHYRISSGPVDGTIIYGRDNSTGTWQQHNYDANGNYTFTIDSERGVINLNDGWGGNNPFDASISSRESIGSFYRSLGLIGGGSGGGGCPVGEISPSCNNALILE